MTPYGGKEKLIFNSRPFFHAPFASVVTRFAPGSTGASKGKREEKPPRRAATCTEKPSSSDHPRFFSRLTD
ncbi:hypothetical protein CEXT_686521 [Caerostris extrusa]|uniref:Uncharacterized protein n=1 Tax=Caerostris extrusa TaxID=172846 RepID=A0AAV4RKI1_CAEEX|nr:hypothetical protein CEXT_686521 [Caerostris extrusa]